MPSRPHLHLRNLSLEPVRFRPYSGGRQKSPAPVRDRVAHGRRLRDDIAGISDEMADFVEAQNLAQVPRDKRGVVITATGFGTQDLWLGDMKASSPGVSLLAVRSADGNEQAQARLFIAQNSLKTLDRQLGEYQAFEDGNPKAQKPMRFPLFESTSAFRRAGLTDIWTGTEGDLPGRRAKSVETWIRLTRAEYFYRMLERLSVRQVGNPTKFTDSVILDVELTSAQMETLLHGTGAVIEFRPSSHFIADYRRATPQERREVTSVLSRRITAASATAPRTVILDSGVAAANPLLSASLPPPYRKTIDAAWGADDDSGHGTNMAGVALFPDLAAAAASTSPIALTTALESVKIVRPLTALNLVSPREAIQGAVRLVERDAGGRRVYSISATIPGEDEDGRQSATSAAIDQLAWNDGARTRLFCVATGNVPVTPDEPYEVAHYRNRNEQFPVQSPAQAVNALSVGAHTEKMAGSLRTVAPAGDLCPVSRTSQNWRVKHRSSNKPDVVFEGGNHVIDPGATTSRSIAETRILTTGHTPSTGLTFTGETSAATAAVSGLATRVLARHPSMRAETIRGLITNGAVWTPAMEAQGRGGPDAMRRVLERFGWGVPDEERVRESATNSLTLVIEDELTPFETREGRCCLKEMKYFELPWPRRELARMRNTSVTLTCTLSYFVESDPLADKRARRDRYPSHRLRFRLNQPGDTAQSAQSRLNQLVESDDEDDLSLSSSQDGNWTVDQRRTDMGTLHQNIWKGPAHELAVRGGVSVYPVKGWWADRNGPEFRRSVPFSLVLSMRTERTDVDLYAEALASVPAHAVLVKAGV